MIPDSWVDRVFARLTVRYGAAFLQQWPDIDVATVKADWRSVLARVPAEALAYGLDNLPPDRPPNALQFRAICNGAPRDDGVLKLSAPRYVPTPEQVAALKRVREGLARKFTGEAV